MCNLENAKNHDMDMRQETLPPSIWSQSQETTPKFDALPHQQRNDAFINSCATSAT